MQRAFHVADGLTLYFHVAVLVNLHGCGDVGVAQYGLRVLRGHVQVFEQGGSDVPRGV